MVTHICNLSCSQVEAGRSLESRSSKSAWTIWWDPVSNKQTTTTKNLPSNNSNNNKPEIKQKLDFWQILPVFQETVVIFLWPNNWAATHFAHRVVRQLWHQCSSSRLLAWYPMVMMLRKILFHAPRVTLKSIFPATMGSVGSAREVLRS
jgi:hypothetical protein